MLSELHDMLNGIYLLFENRLNLLLLSQC